MMLSQSLVTNKIVRNHKNLMHVLSPTNLLVEPRAYTLPKIHVLVLTCNIIINRENQWVITVTKPKNRGPACPGARAEKYIYEYLSTTSFLMHLSIYSLPGAITSIRLSTVATIKRKTQQKKRMNVERTGIVNNDALPTWQPYT